MAIFKIGGSVFDGNKLLAKFLSGKWTEQTANNFLLSYVSGTDPVMLIIRGLPGAGKTFLAEFLAQNLLKCLHIDIDKLRTSGTEQRTRAGDAILMQHLIDSIHSLKSNLIVSGVFSSTASVYGMFGEGYKNVIIELHQPRKRASETNINGVSEAQLDAYEQTWEPWPY